MELITGLLWGGLLLYFDPFCGLVDRDPRCWTRGLGFDSERYQIFSVAMSLERGPLILVRINEELLEREVATPV
jgi:hypothetical protein